jgi:hypothetical protein
MSKIVTSPGEFLDIVMIFLYDIISNKDITFILNDDRKKLINTLEKKGLNSILMQYYLYLNSKKRLKYKRIKELFYKFKSDESIIKILPNNIDENNIDENNIDENFYKIKDILRKCIMLMKKQKYNNPNRVITDDMLDKIIEHVLKGEINNG